MSHDLDLSGLEIDTSHPVLVTGATGYVAGWVIKGLLDAGATVHAAVRDPNNTEKVGHLHALASQAPGELRLFATDLLREGSYDEAMRGCEVVFHTASPFITQVEDPQRDLVDPAVKGTQNVLDSVNACPSVRRVVLTSSCAAIYTDAVECAQAEGGRLTEEDWNRTATLDYQPYNYSKTQAESLAWRIAEDQERWRLVVLNPCLVMGPTLNAHPTSESFTLMKRLAGGTMKRGAPRLTVGCVDVRDVARAHLAAAYLPKARGRHILSAAGVDLYEVTQLLREEFGDALPLPTTVMPKWLIWVLAPAAGLDRRYVWRNYAYPWKADTTKSERELGVTYRPLKDTLVEMMRQLIERGEAGTHAS